MARVHACRVASIEGACWRPHSVKTMQFRKMSIGTRLTMVVLCWFAVLMAFGIPAGIILSYTMWKYAVYLSYFGSPVLATIILVIALRHYPASRLFLKGFVAVILVATALAGGFYHCATIASHGSLLKAIELAARTSTGISSSFPSSYPTQLPHLQVQRSILLPPGNGLLPMDVTCESHSGRVSPVPCGYTHLRAHETRHDLVCRLLLEKKKNKKQK